MAKESAKHQTSPAGIAVLIGVLAFIVFIFYAEYHKTKTEEEFISNFEESWNSGFWEELPSYFGTATHKTLAKEDLENFLNQHDLLESRIISRTEVVHINQEPQVFTFIARRPDGSEEHLRVYTRLLPTWQWLFYFSGDWTFVDIELKSEKPRLLRRMR